MDDGCALNGPVGNKPRTAPLVLPAVDGCADLSCWASFSCCAKACWYWIKLADGARAVLGRLVGAPVGAGMVNVEDARLETGRPLLGPSTDDPSADVGAIVADGAR